MYIKKEPPSSHINNVIYKREGKVLKIVARKSKIMA